MDYEKLCIFCKHFKWERAEIGGCGSTMTGPWLTGGDGQCLRGKYPKSWPDRSEITPYDEDDYRKMILRAKDCDTYERVDI